MCRKCFVFTLQVEGEPNAAVGAVRGLPAALERTEGLVKHGPARGQSMDVTIRRADGATPGSGSNHD